MSPLLDPRELWREMTAADRIVSVAVLAAGLALAAFSRVPAAPPTVATVLVGGEPMAALALARDGAWVGNGRLGAVRVEVRGGAVRVEQSGCPQRICVSMGWKRRSGEMIACVPNALVVRLEGGTPEAGTPDAVSR